MDLLTAGVFFFIAALILAVLGLRGAVISMEIAKWLIIVFIVLALISLILGGGIHMSY